MLIISLELCAYRCDYTVSDKPHIMASMALGYGVVLTPLLTLGYGVVCRILLIQLEDD